MDPERDNYADRDLPPPRNLPPLEIIFGLCGVAFLYVLTAVAIFWPRFLR